MQMGKKINQHLINYSNFTFLPFQVSLKAAYQYADETKKKKRVVQMFCLNFCIDYDQRGGLRSLYTLTLCNCS